MTIKRLTKEEIRNTAGVLNPVGHVIIAFPDDAVTADAVKALHEAGFDQADVLAYTAAEATPRLRERVQTASQASTFGYEITLMRRYLTYADEGSGWVVVYAPTDESVERLVAIAKRFNAKCAVRYHRLASEDLI
jgi:hypothetical protein